MIKHIILWTLKDEYSSEEKESIKKKMKEGLEGLQGRIPGLIDIKVNTGAVNGSTADAMLDSTFEDEDALNVYSSHPEHVSVANGLIRPHIKIRSCLNYEI